MNPLRYHQQQLHQIRSSFRDSGAISVIPKPIENAEPDLCEGEEKSETNPEQNLNLGGKKPKDLPKKRVATTVIARILERSFFVKTFEWGIFFLNFFLRKIGTKRGV
jgi:hypothetical protein